MVLGQNPVKKHSKQRSSKDARKHDATDNRRAHQLFSSEPRLLTVIDSELTRPRAPEIRIQERESKSDRIPRSWPIVGYVPSRFDEAVDVLWANFEDAANPCVD